MLYGLAFILGANAAFIVAEIIDRHYDRKACAAQRALAGTIAQRTDAEFQEGQQSLP